MPSAEVRGRFLFVVWDGGGNVLPALALGRRLARRGHAVRVLAPPALRGRVEEAGCLFRSFERTPAWDPTLGRAFEDQMPFMLRLWLGVEAGEDLLAELDRERADALVVDFMLLGALAAAERTRLPTAALVHTLYHLSVEGRWAERLWTPSLPEINETRRRFGLDPLASAPELWARAAAVLVLTPRALDRPVAGLAPNARYVGPVLDDDPEPEAWDLPWVREHPDPLVVVGFSTTYQHQEAALQRVLDALAGLRLRVLLTLGADLAPEEVRPPANTVVRAWVPHAAVLPQAALVVTHAGHGTVMAALAHGVPLLCLPLGRDQGEVAERVVAVGAGRSLPPEASVGELREALEDVLGSPTYRTAAQRMATLIERDGRGARAVDELEGLLIPHSVDALGAST